MIVFGGDAAMLLIGNRDKLKGKCQRYFILSRIEYTVVQRTKYTIYGMKVINIVQGLNFVLN